MVGQWTREAASLYDVSYESQGEVDIGNYLLKVYTPTPKPNLLYLIRDVVKKKYFLWVVKILKT